MAKISRYQTVIWKDHTGTHTGCLLDDSDIIAVSKSRKNVLQQLKDFLQFAHKKNVATEVDFLKPKLSFVKVSVFPEYNENDRTYATRDSVKLVLPCVVGQRDTGLPTAFFPTLDESFEFHDDKTFDQLCEHYVRAFAKGLSPQDISRYLPPSSVEIEEISVTLKDQNYRYKNTENIENLGQFADHAGSKNFLKSKRTWEREQELSWLEEVLAKESNSVCLVGSSGCGKSSLLIEAARRVELKQVQNGARQRRRIFWMTNAGRIISGMKFLGQWEERFEHAVSELADMEGVLCLDNLQELIKLGGQSAESSIASFMLPFIQNQELRIVVEATPEEMDAYDRLLPGLIDQFQVLKLESFNEEKSKRILKRNADAALQQDKVNFAPESIEVIFQLFQRFQPYDSFPSKVMHFMDNLREDAIKSNNSVVDCDLVWLKFSQLTGLPLDFLKEDISLSANEIREKLSAQVLGQDPAVRVISDMLIKFKAGMNDPARPLGVFLCCGPTGVGKTALVSALGEMLFTEKPEKDRLIRLDMSEYAGFDASVRLLGHPQGQPSEMIRKVRANPYTILLLDEVEKASDEVFDILLNVFDEGRLTDSFGRKTYFNSTIIIMTSNLGAGLSSSMGFATGAEQTESVDTSVIKRFFRPEFFNRLDQVIYFNALTQKLIEQITRKELTELAEREGLQDRGLSLQFSDQLVVHLAKNGFDPKYGARPLQRIIESTVTAALAQHLVARPELRDEKIMLTLDGKNLLIENHS